VLGVLGVVVGLLVVMGVTFAVVLGVAALDVALESADLRRDLDVAQRQAAIAGVTVETITALAATAGARR
jgi:hypothetical protein